MVVVVVVVVVVPLLLFGQTRLKQLVVVNRASNRKNCVDEISPELKSKNKSATKTILDDIKNPFGKNRLYSMICDK